ncbi:MAG TPA: hypothetical protein DF699_10545 [Phycisphaerales bacterium]|nr:hypothetical protein [Phycisphaerales bacterium]
MADLYDRIVHPAYTITDSEETRKSRPPVYALNRMMREPYRSWVDPIVLQSLVTVCPAYAPGSRVGLSDGREAVVIDWDPRDPCRPVVREVTHFEDPDFGEVIDLREQPEIVVIEYDGFDVERYNFYPEHKHAFDLRMVEKAMCNGMYKLNPDEINAAKGIDGDLDATQAA